MLILAMSYCKVPLLFGNVPCVLNLSRTFSIRMDWILFKAFSLSNEMVM